MAFLDIGIAFWHLLAVVIAIAIKASRGYAPKRLTAADLVSQADLVRKLVAYSLRDAQASSADVEDIAQDVIADAWQASESDRYRPDPAKPAVTALKGWLRGIAYHRVSHYRDRVRLRREELMDDPPDAPASTPGADALLEREDERRLLRAALLTLPPEIRAIVVAHDIDELDMKDIAQQLGRPLSSVYKWRARGLAALLEAPRKVRE